MWQAADRLTQIVMDEHLGFTEIDRKQLTNESCKVNQLGDVPTCGDGSAFCLFFCDITEHGFCTHNLLLRFFPKLFLGSSNFIP